LGRKKRITIIGSGNVAYHLAKNLFRNRTGANFIYSRNKKAGDYLARQVFAHYTKKIEETVSRTDIYMMAVSDDAIKDVVNKLEINNKILVHTSGIANTDMLKIATENYGCFYPLQTFTKKVDIEDYRDIPILITASNLETEKTLVYLAKKISKKVVIVSDFDRQKIHLSAVFVNNFTNHLFSLSSQYLSENNLDFNLLKPLILETVNKIMKNKPIDNQTGPAKRNDKETINIHLNLLKDENLKEIYNVLTKSIYNTHNE